MLHQISQQGLLILMFIFFYSCKAQTHNKEYVKGEVKKNKSDDDNTKDNVYILIKNYLPDTSYLVDDEKKLSRYIFSKSRGLRNYLDSIGTNSDSKISTEDFKSKCNILFDDYQQYLWFKYVKQSPKDLKAMVMLSFASPYSKLVRINERIEIYKSFPVVIQNTEQGKKTWKKLQEYSYNNTGKPFFNTTLWAINKDGERVSINELFAKIKKKCLVVFGASYCGPCILQEKLLATQYNKVDTANYMIIGLSTDASLTKWFDYVKKEKLPWKTFVIDSGMLNPIVTNLNFEGVPRNFLLDENGIIIEEHSDFRFFKNMIY
ncbi:MAG: thioredoxin family protein [Ferruginibacter sp.]|nr:thioredoxin family protein [Ferruginibacter sp.]